MVPRMMLVLAMRATADLSGLGSARVAERGTVGPLVGCPSAAGAAQAFISTPEQFAAPTHTDQARRAKLINYANITLD